MKMTKDCTRSHPHEEMDCCCEHKSNIAKLTNHLAHAEYALQKIADSIVHDSKCWPLRKIAQDALWIIKGIKND
jgi:hypothetical protein